jgi:hypothetical protein
MMRPHTCSTGSAFALVPAVMLAAAVTVHAQTGAPPQEAPALQQTSASTPWTIQAPPPKLVLIADRATSLVAPGRDDWRPALRRCAAAVRAGGRGVYDTG